MIWFKTQEGVLINAAQIGAIQVHGSNVEWFEDASDEARKVSTAVSGHLFAASNGDEKLAANVYAGICNRLAISETFIDIAEILRNISLHGASA